MDMFRGVCVCAVGALHTCVCVLVAAVIGCIGAAYIPYQQVFGGTIINGSCTHANCIHAFHHHRGAAVCYALNGRIVLTGLRVPQLVHA